MSDINELRRKVNSTDIVDHIYLHANIKPLLSEMLDRLDAAEKSDAESLAMYRRARDERDALRAKVVEMEKQEPVAWARKLGMDLPSFGCVTDLKYRPSNMPESAYMPLYALPVAQAQPAPSFADAYQGAMEEVAIWKKRALEAEDLNRKFSAEINGPTYMGEPTQPAPSVPDGWKLVPIEPTTGMIDAAEYVDWGDADVRGSCINAWNRMLSVAPEAKP